MSRFPQRPPTGKTSEPLSHTRRPHRRRHRQQPRETPREVACRVPARTELPSWPCRACLWRASAPLPSRYRAHSRSRFRSPLPQPRSEHQGLLIHPRVGSSVDRNPPSGGSAGAWPHLLQSRRTRCYNYQKGPYPKPSSNHREAPPIDPLSAATAGTRPRSACRWRPPLQGCQGPEPDRNQTFSTPPVRLSAHILERWGWEASARSSRLNQSKPPSRRSRPPFGRRPHQRVVHHRSSRTSLLRV